MEKLSLVVAMYNEEAMASHFLEVLSATLDEISDFEKEIIIVNDGSNDKTLEILRAAQQKYKDLKIVSLSRNFGHEAAIAAGLNIASGDAIIPLDGDLQDPPYLIPLMLEKYREGYDVVNAKRAKRKGDTLFKKWTASAFYKLIDSLSGKVKVPQNVGHYRLISRRVLNEVIKLNDYVRVFRVEVPFVGFKTCEITFERGNRTLGKTHYNIKAMTDLAMDAIVSTSIEPLKLITNWTIGFAIVFLFSVVALIITFSVDVSLEYHLIATPYYVLWLALEIVYLLFVIIMTVLSVMSQYLGRTYLEAQKRPFYIIDKIFENKK